MREVRRVVRKEKPNFHIKTPVPGDTKMPYVEVEVHQEEDRTADTRMEFIDQ